MMHEQILLVAATLALSACVSAPVPVATALPPAQAAAPAQTGPQTYHGTFRFGFEVSSFEGCSMNMRGGVWDEFERRHPDVAETRYNGGAYYYEISFEGTRQDGGRFGHMGRYDCEYVATRLLESRRIP